MIFRATIAALNVFARLKSLETFKATAMAKFDNLDAAIGGVSDLLTTMEAEISALQAANANDDSADIDARATKLANLVSAAKAALNPPTATGATGAAGPAV